MVKLIQIDSGTVFGRLVVMHRAAAAGAVKWRCKCECGSITDVHGKYLRNGRSTSCGCYRAELLSVRRPKHGHLVDGQSKTYTSWAEMWRRCTKINNSEYKNYGGRGISVCDRWSKFENFLSDMGERPHKKTLDRINQNGNYEPSNCRWASSWQQTRPF